MARYLVVWVLLAAMGVGILLAACGGEGEGPRPVATSGAAEPTSGGPSATATAAAAPTGRATATGTVAATPTAEPSTTGGPSPPASLGPRISVDMDPAGNSCPSDGTDCTVGSIQECVSIPNVPGATFNVDVVVTGLSNGILGFNYNIYFSDANFTITAQTHDDPMVNLLARSAGSSIVEQSADLPNPPGMPPILGPPHRVMVLNWGTLETTPPFTQGVLGRYEFTVAAGATPGSYDVTLEKPPLSAYLDQDGSEYDIDPSPATGVIALGEACP